MDFASVASLANSGAMRKNFVRALAFRVIPTSPPDTFIERFRCSSALSPPTAQNELHKMKHLCSYLLPSCHW